MSIADAFAPVDALNRDIIMAQTWGFPQPRIEYPFKVLVCCTEMGETTPLRSETHPHCDNPFFWEDVVNVLWEKLKLQEGQLYSWVGTYRKNKTGSCVFKGTLTLIPTDYVKGESNA